MSEAPGSVALTALAADIDIRTDLPQYRIWQDGMLTERCDNVTHVWEDDWIAFALGCSFSFEEALIGAGIAVRNIIEGVNVPMYRTNIPCTPAGPFRAIWWSACVPCQRPTPLKRFKFVLAFHLFMARPSISGTLATSALMISAALILATPSPALHRYAGILGLRCHASGGTRGGQITDGDHPRTRPHACDRS